MQQVIMDIFFSIFWKHSLWVWGCWFISYIPTQPLCLTEANLQFEFLPIRYAFCKVVSWWPNAEAKAPRCSHKRCLHTSQWDLANSAACVSFPHLGIGDLLPTCSHPPLCAHVLPPVHGNILSRWLQIFVRTPMSSGNCSSTAGLQIHTSTAEGLSAAGAQHWGCQILKVMLMGCFATYDECLDFLTPGYFQEPGF